MTEILTPRQERLAASMRESKARGTYEPFFRQFSRETFGKLPVVGWPLAVLQTRLMMFFYQRYHRESDKGGVTKQNG